MLLTSWWVSCSCHSRAAWGMSSLETSNFAKEGHFKWYSCFWSGVCNLQWIAWKNDAMHVSVSFVWNACASHVMHESWEPHKDPMARLFQQRKYQLLWDLLCGNFMILHSKVPTVFYQVWGVAFFPGLRHLQYLHECYQYANMKGEGLRDHIMCNDVM